MSSEPKLLSLEELLEKLNNPSDPNLKITQRTIVPFIGAGLSKNLGYPLWNEFVDRFLTPELNRMGCNVDLNSLFLDPAEATEFFVWTQAQRYDQQGDKDRESVYEYGKKRLRDHIMACFREYDDGVVRKLQQNDPSCAIHKTLLTKFPMIYTTNWDTALEKTADSLGKIYIQKYLDIHIRHNNIRILPKTFKNKHNSDPNTTIVKLHGHYDGSELSLVASRSDYHYRLSILDNDDNTIDKDWKTDMTKFSFLFMGYSLRDVNVNYVLDHMRNTINGISFLKASDVTRLYLITYDKPLESQAAFLKDWYNITSVYLLNEQQESTLNQVNEECRQCLAEKEYLSKCRNCREYWTCDKKVRYRQQKSQFFSERLLNLLNGIEVNN